MQIKHREMSPSVHVSAYIAPTAVLSGQLRIGSGSCVLHGAVLAADGGPVDVGENCVIMEHAVLRGTPRHPLAIGNPLARWHGHDEVHGGGNPRA